jgi:hypothetical protein
MSTPVPQYHSLTLTPLGSEPSLQNKLNMFTSHAYNAVMSYNYSRRHRYTAFFHRSKAPEPPSAAQQLYHTPAPSVVLPPTYLLLLFLASESLRSPALLLPAS